MADKGTGGDLVSEFEGLGEKLKAAALVRAEGLIDWTEGQLTDLAKLTDDAAKAIAGDTRAQAHLEAQLALKKFQAEARAYLESAAIRAAIADALLEVAGSLISAGAKAAAAALAGALV